MPDRGQTYTGRVVIDGRMFVECAFNGATLVYFGGAPPGFQGCRFDGARWDFKSSALNTVSLLRAFARPESGFRGLFDEIFAPKPPQGAPADEPPRQIQ